MVFVGTLGSSDSQLGNIELAGLGEVQYAAISEIVIGQEADVIVVTSSAAANSLALVSEAQVRRQYIVSETSALSLSNAAATGTFFASASNSLTLDDVADRETVPAASATSTLNLTVSARCSAINVSANSVISLSHTEHVIRPWYVSASTPLQTTQILFDIETQTTYEVITSGLQQTVVLSALITHTVSTVIPFISEANGYVLRSDAIAADATSALSLAQTAKKNKTADASSELALSDAATGASGRFLSNSLELTNTASFILVSRETATSPLEIGQTVRYVLEQSMSVFLYTPFIGSTTGLVTPAAPSPTLPEAAV